MRESSGGKPSGAMKVKFGLAVGSGRILAPRRGAHYRPVSVSRRRGGARAYTLGPERW